MFDKIFGNIGKKIKLIAKIFFCIFIVCIVASIVLLVVGAIDGGNEDLFIVSGCAASSGLVVFFVGSLFIYAFGELVENSTTIADALKK